MGIFKRRRRAGFKLHWHHEPTYDDPELKPWLAVITLDGNDVWTGWYDTRDDGDAWNGFAHHLRMAIEKGRDHD